MIRIFFASLLIAFLFSSCSFSKKALDKYRLDNVREEILTVDNFAYNQEQQLVVSFYGKYLGKKKFDDFYFLLDLNEVITRNNRFKSDSIHYLPNSLSAKRIYAFDHDYDPKSEDFLNIEIRKSSVKKGKYKGKTYPLGGKAEVMNNGRNFSLDIYDEEQRLLNPEVIQFIPETPWQTKGKKYERISFVLEPTFNKNELNLLWLPPALALDASLLIGQIIIIGIVNNNVNRNRN